MEKGFVKEYDMANLKIFEGYYLNGERNGKGNEIDKGYDFIIFDGDYFKGKKWLEKYIMMMEVYY